MQDALDRLRAIALDLRWTWSHRADALWQRLDPATWERTRNPWSLLQSLPHDRLAEVIAEPGFADELDRLVALHDASTTRGAEVASTLTLPPKRRGRESTGGCQVLRLPPV